MPEAHATWQPLPSQGTRGRGIVPAAVFRMFSRNESQMPRFALLEHTGAPSDPTGRHFDLLLETASVCRTWRLMTLPEAGGAVVPALELPPHRLAWLDHVAGEVSGGRGEARRVDAGTYEVLSSDAADPIAATAIVVQTSGENLNGRLRLEAFGAGWAASLS